MTENMSKQPPPAPTASTIGPCPTEIQVSRTPRYWKFTQHLRTTQPPLSIIYGSARKSYLEMLDPIHHQGLILALGAFITSPSESLLAEANEPSLYNRRLKLSMQYALKLKSNPLNPAYETVFEPQYKTLFENKPNMIPSFGIRISSEFENLNLDLDNIAEFKVPDVPPWTFSQPRVLFSLHNDKKSQTDPLVFRTKYHELLSNFPSYETIFTDG